MSIGTNKDASICMGDDFEGEECVLVVNVRIQDSQEPA